MKKRKEDIKKEYRKEVDQIVKTITEKYQPEKIIAFGSTARGNPTEDSDIDLLVIKKTKKVFWDRVEEVVLMTSTRRSVDVSVLTPEELKEAYKKNWYFITEEMLKKGKVLYER